MDIPHARTLPRPNQPAITGAQLKTGRMAKLTYKELLAKGGDKRALCVGPKRRHQITTSV